MKTVLTIAGSDSSGGAGIQADLKTFAAFGVYGTTVITAVTAQNTQSVEGIFELPADIVTKQINAVMNDIRPTVWKTGMLVNQEIIEQLIQKIKQYEIKFLIVDPVMVSKSGHNLLSVEARRIMIKKLIPLSFIITPNYDEVEVMTGIRIIDNADVQRAARIIYKMGAKHVVIKGGHSENNLYTIDTLYNGKIFREFMSKRIKTKNTHGAGCTFAAAVAAGIAKGTPIFTAVKNAKKYIYQAIKTASTLHIGHGFGPLNHFPKKI